MKTTGGRQIIAAILILGGLILLLDNLDIIRINLSRYVFRWYSILLLVGVVLLLKGENKSGILLSAVGGLFLIAEFFSSIYFNIFDLWPAILVVAGAMILRKRTLTSQPREGNDHLLDEVAIFGGNQIRLDSKQFRGGHLTAIFGGSTIDLRGCSLATGEQQLRIFSLFGGSKIIVPDGMSVKIEVEPVLGELSDKRRVIQSEHDTDMLRVTGTIVLSGCQVMN